MDKAPIEVRETNEDSENKLGRRKFVAFAALGLAATTVAAKYGIEAAGGDTGNKNEAVAAETSEAVSDTLEYAGNSLTPLNPERFADTDSDPEALRLIVEKAEKEGDYEEVVRLFNITTKDVPLKEEDHEKAAMSYAQKLEKGLNAGCTEAEVKVFLETDNKDGFIEAMIDKYDLHIVKGIYGLEGTKAGWGDEVKGAPVWNDEDILLSDQYQYFTAAHRAVLNGYFNAITVAHTLDQSVSVAVERSELADSNRDGSFAINTGLVISKVAKSVEQPVSVFDDQDIPGSHYVAFSPNDKGFYALGVKDEQDELDFLKQVTYIK